MFILSQRLKSYLIAIAILEIAAFIMVASWIGLFRCIVLMCLTSAIGIALLKRCGLNLPQPGKPQAKPQPKPGLLLAIILIILPGFISDIAGIILLIPQLRSLISRIPLFSSLKQPKQPKQPIKKHNKKQNQQGDIIEGEVIEGEVITPKENNSDKNNNHKTDNHK